MENTCKVDLNCVIPEEKDLKPIGWMILEMFRVLLSDGKAISIVAEMGKVWQCSSKKASNMKST